MDKQWNVLGIGLRKRARQLYLQPAPCLRGSGGARVDAAQTQAQPEAI